MPNQKLYFSTSAKSLSRGEGGGLACYLQTEREKRQRFPVAISHLICTPLREGSLSAFLNSLPLQARRSCLSRLFARIWEIGIF